MGEIEDEFDLPDTSVERVDDKRIRIGGDVHIDDFNEEFGTELDAGGLQHDGRARVRRARACPGVGDSVTTDGLRLTVLEIEGSRIMRIEVEFGVETPTDEPEAADSYDPPRDMVA